MADERKTPTGEAASGDRLDEAAERRLYIVLGLAAVLSLAFSAALALGAFTWGLPNEKHVQSYHPDEQNVTYSLRNMNPGKLDFNPRFYGNPTFYTYQVGALAFAGSSAGALPGDLSRDYWLSHPEAVGRFYLLGRGLSFVYALLSVWLVYLVARRVSGSKAAGALAAAIFASLPVFAVHSHYMTVSSSAVFWSLLAIFFALGIRERPSWGNYILAGLAAGFAVSTKLNNAFVPLAIFAAHLEGAKGPLSRRLFSGKLWACAAVIAAAFAAGSPYYVLSFSTVRADAHSQMNLAALLDFSTPLSLLLKDFWNHLSASCGQAMAVLFLISAVAAFGKVRKRVRPLLAVVAPFLLLALKSGFWAFGSRMLPMLALMAVLTAVIARHLPAGAWRRCWIACIVVGLLVTAPWNAAYLNIARSEHVRSVSSRWIVKNIPQSSRVIVLDTPYYDDPDIIYENALHPRHTSWPRYEVVNIEGRYESLAATSGDWLVVPERFDGKLKGAGLGDIASYAEGSGFVAARSFSGRFAAFGIELRDWVPADMVQNYPVFIFRREPAED